ncbi:MAG: dihydropteroate synthase [Pseudomonadota bacterium]
MNSWFNQKIWKLAHGQKLELGPKSLIMGILNVTPDSFSDGGEFIDLNAAVEQAGKMLSDGAAIIDVGGESTRPGAEPVSAHEEQDRVLPIIEALAGDGRFIISIDTYRAETADLAIRSGAHIINDVWGFQKDPEIAGVAASHDAGICSMHTGRDRQKDPDVIKDQLYFLGNSIDAIKRSGNSENAIVVDPGFGFAKDPPENAQLLARFEELHALGYPLLVGTSRKRFIGHYTGQHAGNRDIGTAATSVVARMKGGAVFRVHDVAVNANALSIADAIISNRLVD